MPARPTITDPVIRDLSPALVAERKKPKTIRTYTDAAAPRTGETRSFASSTGWGYAPPGSEHGCLCQAEGSGGDRAAVVLKAMKSNWCGAPG